MKDQCKYHICYLSPTRLVVLDGEDITFSLDEINSGTYDHSLLCRIVGQLTNTYKGVTLDYLVCGDGAICVYNNKSFTANDLILNYNDLFCKLLIAGMETESISNKDLTSGWKHGENSIWPVNFGHSLSSNMHGRIRMKLANAMESISLDSAYKSAVTISQLKKYLEVGNTIVSPIKNLSTFYLISGISELIYGNWSSALSNLWIIVEQLIDFLWEHKFLNDKSRNPDIPTRLQTLKQDHRTYTASVKQEILFQLDIIPEQVYRDLYTVRKARNKLVHEGLRVNRATALSLYIAISVLLPIASGNTEIPLCNKRLGIIDRMDLIEK